MATSNFMMQFFSQLIAFLAQGWQLVGCLRPQLVGLMALALFGLTGCVDSEVGIRFDSPNRGEIVQQIRFDERLRSLNGDRVRQWATKIEQSAASVGGRVQRTADQTLILKIPFYSSDELEQKFNQFFNSLLNPTPLAAGGSVGGLPAIDSQLSVIHSNFLLLERNRLRYEVDLRSLGVLSSSGALLVSPASLIQLELVLETPWGARSVNRAPLLRPRLRNHNHQLIWTLVPGEENVFEAVFWLPSPIGLGTLSIILLILLGRFVYQSQPLNSAQPRSVV